MISSAIFSRTFELKGGVPVANSYSRMPKLHQSALASCPYSFNISGDIYSGVPQMENAFSVFLLLEVTAVSSD